MLSEYKTGGASPEMQRAALPGRPHCNPPSVQNPDYGTDLEARQALAERQARRFSTRFGFGREVALTVSELALEVAR